MSMQRIAQVVAFAVATSVALPSFAAVPNAGGEYMFSTSYGNDYRTTGQTGDQIWNVQNPITGGTALVYTALPSGTRMIFR